MSKGTLYIIASPIGNLEDITYRAVRILKEEITRVFCEDTRQTRKLLDHYGIDLPATSLHAHSGSEKIRQACTQLEHGDNLAYLSDCGTPGISDPGSLLVREARERDIPIVPIPGPSALSALVSVSGFPEKQVIFTGFLSKRDGRMRRELQSLSEQEGIIVIYESPYRIKRLVKMLAEIFPGKEVLIGREMTKFYEQFYHGKAGEILENIDSITEKGEFAVAVFNRLSSSREEDPV